MSFSFILSAYSFCQLSYVFFRKSLTDHESQGPPKKLAPCLAEPHLTDRRYNFSLEKKQQLNINIASFFLETLASPNEKSWHDTGGPITKTINHFSLNPNHRRSVEKTRKTMMSYLDKGAKYTGNNETKKMVDLTLYLLLMK